ncbi:AAA family ATPase [Moritella sp. 24]|uniref:AAA family ATPase n=1 Tax=Moritella sp. 24 TaxID=2746230 RepID=UPI001BA63B9B|nr:AAA family ATPase [Moritella sp. 24]QUM76589.1 AAA family ATPase [Moritella sp. 24]
MNDSSSNNILGFDSASTTCCDVVSQPMILPYPLNVLIICNNNSIEQGLTAYFATISNIQVEYCTLLPSSLSNFSLVLLVLDDNIDTAKHTIEKFSKQEKHFLLLGDNIKSELIRLAIHHNVKDIISIADIEKELYLSLLTAANDLINSSKIAPVFTIINGKSGSGASFITSCLGEISANLTTEEIAILDADLNYGTLTDTFNFEPNYFITDALEDLDQLDNTAIRSMMLKRNNLSFLASKPYTLLNANPHLLERLPQLIWKVKLNHDLVLIDLSRGLETHSNSLISLSDKVIVVVQQNIISLREAKVLIQQLTTNVGIPAEKLHIIVNRHSHKGNNISIKDIKNVLDVESIFIVSNNYELANAGINSGSPILKVANHKIIQDEISHIIREIFPLDIPDIKPSLFTKIFRRK